MALRSLIRAALKRKRSSAAPVDEAAPAVTGPSSIEYRESYRGFLLRVSANASGLYSVFIEDPQGLDPGYARTLPEHDKRFPADGFTDLTDAIDAAPAAKAVIDECLRQRGNA